MRNQLLFVLFLTVVSTIFWGTSTAPTDIIYWTSESKLSWDDFKGDPNYKHDYKDISAMTVSGIVDYRGCENEEIIYMIKSYFEKHNSWVKHVGRNDHTLEHEQIHFDITELYARKLRKELSTKTFACGQEAEFEDFVNDFLKGWQKMQEDYDIGTGYSNNHSEQHQWVNRVESELKELEEFKSK